MLLAAGCWLFYPTSVSQGILNQVQDDYKKTTKHVLFPPSLFPLSSSAGSQ
jgi:hypothetical protein